MTMGRRGMSLLTVSTVGLPGMPGVRLVRAPVYGKARESVRLWKREDFCSFFFGAGGTGLTAPPIHRVLITTASLLPAPPSVPHPPTRRRRDPSHHTRSAQMLAVSRLVSSGKQRSRSWKREVAPRAPTRILSSLVSMTSSGVVVPWDLRN